MNTKRKGVVFKEIAHKLYLWFQISSLLCFWFQQQTIQGANIHAAFLPEHMSGGKTLFITLLPLPPTQPH